jgi:predicted metal-dependent enzyme (double-stranded beta helix superfamily)
MLKGRNWLIDNEGRCHEFTVSLHQMTASSPYRLYRFLSDLDDLLERTPDDRDRLQSLSAMVRQLLADSPWLYLASEFPQAEAGWSVSMLYDEPNYPHTVQMVSWQSGCMSPIHNHGTWGLVLLLEGCEKNSMWRCDRTTTSHLEPTLDLILEPGDLICFLPDAIHCIEALGTETTISFNLYGETQRERRFQFDRETHAATPF